MKHTVTTKLSRPLLVYVCVVGEYYILNSYIRVKSEGFCLATNRDTVVEQLDYDATMERRQTMAQFASFHILLRDGHPIGDYAGKQELSKFLWV